MEEPASENLLRDRDEILVKGFLPRLYNSAICPGDFYSSYFATYVERDVRRLINVKDIARCETFIRLLAGRAGQLVNLSALEASFVVFRFHPYQANIGKRLVKTPKLYFTEPGLLTWLLQIETPAQVSRDPLLGGIFENMVLMEAVKAAYNRGTPPQLSFYRDKSSFEIDLIREYQRRPFAIEVKPARPMCPT